MAKNSFESIDPGQAAIEKMIVDGSCPPIPREAFDAACSGEVRITPNWLVGAGVSMCRQWFGSDERLTVGRPLFKWNPDHSLSHVFISEDDNWDFETVGKRPAIIVDLGDISHVSDGASTVLGGPSGGNTVLHHLPDTGEIVFGSWDSGILGFRCVSKSRAECRELSWEVKCFLQTYAPTIRGAYDLEKFVVQATTRPVRIKEYEEYLVSTVSVSFVALDMWAFAKESLRAQAICLTIPIS